MSYMNAKMDRLKVLDNIQHLSTSVDSALKKIEGILDTKYSSITKKCSKVNVEKCVSKISEKLNHCDVQMLKIDDDYIVIFVSSGDSINLVDLDKGCDAQYYVVDGRVRFTVNDDGGYINTIVSNESFVVDKHIKYSVEIMKNTKFVITLK